MSQRAVEVALRRFIKAVTEIPAGNGPRQGPDPNYDMNGMNASSGGFGANESASGHDDVALYHTLAAQRLRDQIATGRSPPSAALQASAHERAAQAHESAASALRQGKPEAGRLANRADAMTERLADQGEDE